MNQEAFGSSENTLTENNNSNIISASLNTSTNSNQANATQTVTSHVSNSLKFNSSIEFENQFILRMPVIKRENGMIQPHPATLALREALSKTNILANAEENAAEIDHLKDRLFIDLNVDTRKGRVKFGEYTIFNLNLL